MVAVAISSMVGGYRLGLVTGGTSCVLLVQGLVLATLAVPSVVTFLGGTDPTVRLIIGAFFFVGVGYGAQYLGRLAGTRFRAELNLGAYEPFDRMAGAAAAPFVVLLGLWLLVLPALSDVTGAPARLARHSAGGPHRRRPPARPAGRVPGPAPPGRARGQPPGLRRPAALARHRPAAHHHAPDGGDRRPGDGQHGEGGGHRLPVGAGRVGLQRGP